MAQPQRPLSPHIQQYKWQITMTLSILHRFTGVVLSVAIAAFALWFIVLSSGPEAFAHLQACLNSILGKFVLFGFSAALFYHLCNGIRHLVWDAGKGFSIKGLYGGGYAVLIVASLLTIGFWACVLGGGSL